MENSNLKQYYT